MIGAASHANMPNRNVPVFHTQNWDDNKATTSSGVRNLNESTSVNPSEEPGATEAFV